jgi:hypothetical protein
MDCWHDKIFKPTVTFFEEPDYSTIMELACEEIYDWSSSHQSCYLNAFELNWIIPTDHLATIPDS